MERDFLVVTNEGLAYTGMILRGLCSHIPHQQPVRRMSIAEAAVSLDPVAYAKLTDSFFETRLLENEEAALESACESYKKHFMDRKLMRNIIMWEVPTHLEDPGVKDLPPPKTFVKKVLELSTRQTVSKRFHHKMYLHTIL